MRPFAFLVTLSASSAALAHPGDHHAVLPGALSHPVLGGMDPLLVSLILGGIGLAAVLVRK